MIIIMKIIKTIILDIIYIYNEEKEGNFAIILNNYEGNSLNNHFCSCKCKTGIDISEEKLEQIKRKILDNNIYRKKK